MLGSGAGAIVCSLRIGQNIKPADGDSKSVMEDWGGADMTQILKLDTWTKISLGQPLGSVKRLQSPIGKNVDMFELYYLRINFLPFILVDQIKTKIWKFGLDPLDLK